MTTRRLAVVGSGVAGLTAAYVASRTAEVTLYEADTRLGGHADTHLVADPATGRELAIDTGFIVHNQRTYPVLLRLFAELGVATQESEMSLSTSDEGTGLEWAGALGASRPVPDDWPTCATARYLRMLAEIPRFHRRRRQLLDHGEPWTRPPTSPSASSSTGAGSRRTSGATSSSRSSPPSGRATPPSPPTTPPRTCSRSSATTACSASSARRPGARSPAARGRTSTGSRPRSQRPAAASAPVRRSSRCRRGTTR